MKRIKKIMPALGFAAIIAGAAIVVPILNQNQITNQISIRNQNEKAKQIKQFENISMKEVESTLDDLLEKFDLGTSKGQSLFALDKETSLMQEGMKNIKENKEQILNLVSNIKDGKLLTSDIQKQQQEYINKNQEEYKKVIEDYGIENLVDYSNSENTIKLFSNELNSINITTNTETTGNKVSNLGNGTISITIDKDIEAFIKNARKKYDTFNKYVEVQKNLAISSSVLTGIAWGVAAWYWGAWFMFGANVPFAIAATVQATTLTWFNVESWKSVHFMEGQLKELSSIILSDDYKEIEKIVNGSYKDKFVDYTTGAIALIVDVTSFHYWISSGFKIIYTKIGKIFDLSKNFLINNVELISKMITKFATKTTANEIVLKSTLWANPIGWIITIIDSGLTLWSLCIGCWL